MAAHRRRPPLARVVCGLALAAALALAFRPQASADLGYHLAYGDALLEGRGIVTGADLIAPPPSAAEIAGELPPGAWVDGDGRYRFVNANWLSQAILAAVHRLGGGTGLTLLGVGLVLALLLLQRATIVAWGLGDDAVAVAWMLTAAGAWERFNVRPELGGYVCLAAQLALLAGSVDWRRVAAVAAIQIVAANLHGYWILGLAVAGALALEAVLAWVWRRSAAARSRAVRLLATTVAVAAAPALHPQGLGNLALPFATIGFLRRNAITGSGLGDVRAFLSGAEVHPWALLGEFHATFDGAFAAYPATWCFLLAIVAALVALPALVARGRTGWAAIAVGGIVIGISMRRNLAPAMVLLAPPLVRGLGTIAGWISHRRAGLARGLGHLVRATVAATALAMLVATVTNRLYLDGGWPFRFGAGTSGVMVPRATCAWLDAHLDAPVTAFADPNLASNLVYFSSSVAGVPLLSNTWATPVARMRSVLALETGRAAWRKAFAAAGWQLAVLDTGSIGQPLIRRLQRSDDWALVAVEPRLVAFARRGRPATARLVAAEIPRQGFDVAALLARARATDPTPAATDHVRATLTALDWRPELTAVDRMAPPRR